MGNYLFLIASSPAAQGRAGWIAGGCNLKGEVLPEVECYPGGEVMGTQGRVPMAGYGARASRKDQQAEPTKS